MARCFLNVTIYIYLNVKLLRASAGMIIKWEERIPKEPLDEEEFYFLRSLKRVNPANLTEPQFKTIRKTTPSASMRSNNFAECQILPVADHRSNGFVNNPKLLQQTVFYPIDPTNCWTHTGEAKNRLVYCAMNISENDNPNFYKIIKHGMRFVRDHCHQLNGVEQGVLPLLEDGRVDTERIDWNCGLDNKEFFDLGDLTIVACGEVVRNSVHPADYRSNRNFKGIDIQNVEMYVSKINLFHNEEHFIRLLQAEDIIFSGMDWEFYGPDFKIGPFNSLEICNRCKRKIRWDELSWLDKDISKVEEAPSSDEGLDLVRNSAETISISLPMVKRKPGLNTFFLMERRLPRDSNVKSSTIEMTENLLI